MKKMITSLFLLIHFNSLATELVCQQIGSATSKIKFLFEENKVITISQEVLDTGEFKELDKIIEPVFSDSETQNFIVKNHAPKDIDWSKEPNCFKEIGTTWYFNLSKDSSWVQFYPDIITRDNKCIPPRYRPQGLELRCH